MAASDSRVIVDRLVAFVPLGRWIVVALALLLVVPRLAGLIGPELAGADATRPPRTDVAALRWTAAVDQAIIAAATREVARGAPPAFIDGWPVARPPVRLPEATTDAAAGADVSLEAADITTSVRAIIGELVLLSGAAVGLLVGFGALVATAGAWSRAAGRWVLPLATLAWLGLLLWPTVDPAWTYDRSEPWSLAGQVLFVAGFAALPLQVAAAVGLRAPAADAFLDRLRGATDAAMASRRGAASTVRRLVHLAPVIVASGMFVMARQSYVEGREAVTPGAAGAFLVGTLEAGDSVLGPVRFLVLSVAWCTAVLLVRQLLIELDRVLTPARGGMQR